MSYILEALKKVEQKRQREGIPRLLTLPSDAPEEGPKSRALLYVILGVLVLNAAVMVAWWIAPQQRHRTAVPIVEPLPVQQKTPSITSEKASASTLDTPVPGKSLSGQTAPEVSEKPAPSSNPVPAVNGESTPALKKKTATSITNYFPESQARQKAKHPSPASGARLFGQEELPPAVRGNLPEFKISGHAYSPEPRFRVARVNNKIVQEGEALSHGLKVDEITERGVIFTYQGYRFRVDMQDNH